MAQLNSAQSNSSGPESLQNIRPMEKRNSFDRRGSEVSSIQLGYNYSQRRASRINSTASLNSIADMWTNSSAENSVGLLPGRKVAGPLFLMVTCPIFVIVVIYVLTERHGSFGLLWQDLKEDGIVGTIRLMWQPIFQFHTWKLILGFMGLQAFLMRAVPGKEFKGPITPKGNIPVYTANGFQVYIITLVIFLLGAWLGFWNLGIMYDNIGKLISVLNVFALVICGLLYYKGLVAPSTSDSGSSGNPIFDFYWGTELYPSVLGWNVKQLTNCRLGMMFWPLNVISCVGKQYEVFGAVSSSMVVNAVLQMAYLTKFFWWETGYLATIDIMHDRAGFYIVWGILVWLPTIYTSHTTYLVLEPHSLGIPLTVTLLFGGLVLIYFNYAADAQRKEFRAAQGNLKIWGQDPFFLEAKYKTESGAVKTSLLLGSGYWGFSRHFNYLTEIGLSACWTIPVWTSSLMPWFYVPYLTLLLVDRAVRDDARCRSKYGKYWDKHCVRVPFLLVPHVF